MAGVQSLGGMQIEWELPDGVTRQAVIAVLVCALGALGYWWWSAPVSEATLAKPAVSRASAAPAGAVIVDVVGAVRRPGVVRLRVGSRVIDAVTAAGGVQPGHAPVVNMARVLVDGEQLVVGVESQASAVAGVASGGAVNVNSASAAQLDALPGIGPVLADRIVGYREQHGPFKKLRELLDVPGIGDAKYANLADAVTVG